MVRPPTSSCTLARRTWEDVDGGASAQASSTGPSPGDCWLEPVPWCLLKSCPFRMSTAAVPLAAKPEGDGGTRHSVPAGFEGTQKGPTRPRHGGALIDDATVSKGLAARQVDSEALLGPGESSRAARSVVVAIAGFCLYTGICPPAILKQSRLARPTRRSGRPTRAHRTMVRSDGRLLTASE